MAKVKIKSIQIFIYKIDSKTLKTKTGKKSVIPIRNCFSLFVKIPRKENSSIMGSIIT